MRAILVIAIYCCVLFAHAADEKPSANAVIVKVMENPLPSNDSEKKKFLREHFANKPEEQQFRSYGVKDWKDNFSLFSQSLIAKAKAQKLDSESLRKTLDLVLKDSKDQIAYLPVGAYQTTLDGQFIWIIIVKWEYPSMGSDAELGHIRMFAIDQKTLERVGFNTCK